MSASGGDYPDRPRGGTRLGSRHPLRSRRGRRATQCYGLATLRAPSRERYKRVPRGNVRKWSPGVNAWSRLGTSGAYESCQSGGSRPRRCAVRDRPTPGGRSARVWHGACFRWSDALRGREPTRKARVSPSLPIPNPRNRLPLGRPGHPPRGGCPGVFSGTAARRRAPRQASARRHRVVVRGPKARTRCVRCVPGFRGAAAGCAEFESIQTGSRSDG